MDLILENPQIFDITITAVISQWPKVLMVLLSFGLIYLGVAKKFEPLLLVPIGIGILLNTISYRFRENMRILDKIIRKQ